jgi:hypothetical protein
MSNGWGGRNLRASAQGFGLPIMTPLVHEINTTNVDQHTTTLHFIFYFI